MTAGNDRHSSTPRPPRGRCASGINPDDKVPVDHRHTSPRPQEWQPLVSAPQWLILSHALRDAPEVLNDVRVVLDELSPRVRRALLAHLMQTLSSGVSPVRAIWTSLALTGHDIKLRSAVDRAQLDVHHHPGRSVHELRVVH